MVNLKGFKIRITGTIPPKHREAVEDAIGDTFLFYLIGSTAYFKGISSKKLWKIVYIPWNGFFIQASDTINKNYASIVNWINYGTQEHFIPGFKKFQKMIHGRIKKKFLVFPERRDYIKQEHIVGNQTFVRDGFVYTLIVNHPGIEAKRFIEEIIENTYLNNEFYNLVENEIDIEEIEDYIDFMRRISSDYRYAVGISS